MSLGGIMVFLLCLGATQQMADAVKAALPADRASSWFMAVFVQYVLCTAALYYFDGGPIREVLGPAVMLTYMVRFFSFLKRA